jgi:hypothetical protein
MSLLSALPRVGVRVGRVKHLYLAHGLSRQCRVLSSVPQVAEDNILSVRIVVLSNT